MARSTAYRNGSLNHIQVQKEQVFASAGKMADVPEIESHTWR